MNKKTFKNYFVLSTTVSLLAISADDAYANRMPRGLEDCYHYLETARSYEIRMHSRLAEGMESDSNEAAAFRSARDSWGDLFDNCLKIYDISDADAKRYDVKVKNVRPIDGENPYDPRIGQDTITTTPPVVVVPPPPPPVIVTPPPPPVVTTPPPPPVVTTPPPPPAPDPLAVTVTPVTLPPFLHTVFVSSCPQFIGLATITSNNGNPLTISGISVSGDIASRVDVSVTDNGTATPVISANFNCSSAENGTFTGTATFTVTDTVTGESRTASVGLSGTISG